MKPLLTTEEAAARLRISLKQLRNAVKARLIPCIRINARVWRFSEEALEAWIARKEKRA